MAKQQINVRLPASTVAQITALTKKLDMTQTQIIILAIERLTSSPKK